MLNSHQALVYFPCPLWRVFILYWLADFLLDKYRYEQKSLIITSNLEFSQWNTVLGDNRLTAALIDRLIHHSHIVVFGGESFRLQESIRRQKEVADVHT